MTDMTRPSVLVVEDQDLLQTTLSAFLTLNNFTTYRASDVEQALEVLGRQHIDAVTLDIRLPDAQGRKRNGLTLLRYLRERPEYERLPVVIFTGMPMSDEEELLARRLSAEVVYKPDPYRLVLDGLNRLLGTSSS